MVVTKMTIKITANEISMNKKIIRPKKTKSRQIENNTPGKNVLSFISATIETTRHIEAKTVEAIKPIKKPSFSPPKKPVPFINETYANIAATTANTNIVIDIFVYLFTSIFSITYN